MEPGLPRTYFLIFGNFNKKNGFTRIGTPIFFSFQIFINLKIDLSDPKNQANKVIKIIKM